MSPKVHVAVGVILDQQKNILIAKRPEHLHQGGLWEFPGGKVEAGEDVTAALARELQEELGIQVEKASPLILVEHDYSDKKVLLDVWVVEAFSGKAMGKEQQEIVWVEVSDLSHYQFPAANTAIVEAVQKLLV